jgi:hypothetical protein
MTGGSAGRTRGIVASMAAGLLASAALLVVPGSPASAGAAAVAQTNAAGTISGASTAGGGFGLPQGSLGPVQSDVAADGGYDSLGSCAGYATNVGVGIYCNELSGGPLPALEDRFPGVGYTTCRFYDIPVGMKAPANEPGPGKYYLRACLDGVDLSDPLGGDPRVTLGFDFVGEDEPDPTDWDPTPVDEILWSQVSQNYPTPFATNWPFKIPRVNAPTWFEFRWLDEDLQTAAQGPYAGNENGGPFLEIGAAGVTLTAEADEIRIVPQIQDPEGSGLVDDVTCEVPPLRYDRDAEPTPEAQDSNCFVVFEHSSAAAEELTPDDVPLPPEDPDYPIPMYVIDIEVDWNVTMTAGAESRNLGTHTFVAHQALPVSEVSGLSGPDA